MDQSAQFSVFIATGIAVAFTFAWIGVQVACALRYSRVSGEGAVDKKAIGLWLLSIGGAFTGPFVVLSSLLGLVGGVVMLKRDPAPNERTKAAAVGAIAGATVLLVMVASMVLVMAVGGVFG